MRARPSPALLALAPVLAAAALVGARIAHVEQPPRAQAAVGAARESLVVAWVGDTMLGRDGAHPPGDGRVLFEHVRSWLRAPDLTLGNLEGVLTERGTSKCAGRAGPACFAFRAPPRSAAALRWAGFDAMSVANNHALDYGPDGQADTVRALRDRGIAVTGRPGEITVVRRRGIRVGLVAFAPYPWAQSSLDLAAAGDLVRRAHRRADVVVAMIHAGAEGSSQTHTPVGTEVAFGEDRGDTRRLAHTLADAGAALVLGSGPHVVRGLERRHGRLIAYSLGNFAGWHDFAGGPVLDESGVLRVRLSRDGHVLGGRWLSARLRPPGVPVPEPSHISAQLARSVSRSDFGADAWPMRPDGRLLSWRAGIPELHPLG